LKGGELEERNGNQLPFKFLGYDKSRAFKVYNDSFEITSYAFLAYTDMTDLNKVVNIVVTQKKNGKPGKPYLYEYTLQKVLNRIAPHIAKIVKYKISGVKVDVPVANFNPCIDVICDQYNNPIGGGGTTGSGGSSGGGSGDYGGTSETDGTSGTGYGGYNSFVTCQSYTYTTQTGPTTYLDIVYTECSDGTSTTTYTTRYAQVFTDCCDSENVSIGVVGSTVASLAISKHEYLKSTYADYRYESIDINSFISQYGADKYMATAALYETAKQEGMWPIIDKESATFFLEFFAEQLVPLGITFIPYGIGDAADIFQSCKSGLSWDCSFAAIGLLVPFDELYDLWKNADKLKAVWKTVKNYSYLKTAWKFLQNCPRSVRTNPEVLEGVRVALQRGFRSTSDLASYAANIGANYIDINTINHIFRGSNNGGVHHISAVMSDQSTYKIMDRVDVGNGVYKAKVSKNGVQMSSSDPLGKTFFPDIWTENQVIDAIKGAWNTKVERKDLSFNSFVGTHNGIQIQMFISNGKIISAFPYGQ
jgi:Bacterial EndoU nuclease